MASPAAALSNVRRLLLNDPADVQIMLLYSKVLILTKNYAAAKKVLQLISERPPDNAEMHRQLALLALVDKNLPMARKEFLTAWNLQRASRLLLEEVLRDYAAEKRTDEAVEFLREQIERRPADSLLYHELGQVFPAREQKD